MRKLSLLILLSPFTLQAQQDADILRGHEVFENWCSPCHAPGWKHPGTQALDAFYKGERPGALEQPLVLTPEFIATFVRQGVSIMPFFCKTEISDADLARLSAYLIQHP
jgi:mono/diheme cytochrome c family protein